MFIKRTPTYLQNNRKMVLKFYFCFSYFGRHRFHPHQSLTAITMKKSRHETGEGFGSVFGLVHFYFMFHISQYHLQTKERFCYLHR